MKYTRGLGKFLHAAGTKLMKEERETAIEDDVFSSPNAIIIDLNTQQVIHLASGENPKGRTQGHGYRRMKDSKQRIPHKVPPTLIQGVLLDMLVPMLAKKIGDEDGLDYSSPGQENWSPLVKAAYRRIGDALIEAQELGLSNDKEAAKHWKEEHAKHKEEIQIVIDKLKDMTWNKKSGDMLANMTINDDWVVCENLIEEFWQVIANDNRVDIDEM